MINGGPLPVGNSPIIWLLMRQSQSFKCTQKNWDLVPTKKASSFIVSMDPNIVRFNTQVGYEMGKVINLIQASLLT